ncbi:hypothetical protein, partial [Lysinibacillus xylanilyticus]|uniref:hypothetical protein n=1 Tax=Lysinibacillus xylanilyticus TaxID=582475 RepID=UPI0036DCECCD
EAEDSGIHSESEIGELLEKQLSKEDVIAIYNQQLHHKLVGQQFEVTEVGEVGPRATDELVLIVPKVKLSVEVIEKALDASATDDLSKYMTFLPPETEEEKVNRRHCVTGNTLRTFLNGMQEDDSDLNMNAQLEVYSAILTSMPDDDPTKKFALMQMRAAMQYGDVVSNKNLRLAVTQLLEEELSNG